MTNGGPAPESTTAASLIAPTGKIYNNVWVWAAIALTWLASWALLWLSAEGWDWIYEPAVVGASLGVTALIIFPAIYVREETDKLKGAIAATFIVLFILLFIYLLTIRDFREALSTVQSVDVPAATTDASDSSGALVTPCPSPSPQDDPTTQTDSGETPAQCIPAAAVAVSWIDGLFSVFT
jgi:hypothetical protein